VNPASLTDKALEIAKADLQSEPIDGHIEKFRASLNGQNEDYTKKRVLAKLPPLTFELKSVVRVTNRILSDRHVAYRERLAKARHDTKNRLAFHGTRADNIYNVCNRGLLRIGHPLNPSTSTDDGYFGTPTRGVYVGRNVDYVLKYSNGLRPLKEKESCKIVVFEIVPGNSKKIEQKTPGMLPTAGYDSHTSSADNEWYLFDERALRPIFIWEVQAVANLRVRPDDQ